MSEREREIVRKLRDYKSEYLASNDYHDGVRDATKEILDWIEHGEVKE